MKCSLFTEIQCREGSSPAARLEEFLDQAELADRLGFSTYWVAEIHCQPRFSLLSAPYVVLGAAAQRTKRLRLGVAVNTLPVHHPVQLAEAAAMLDLFSGGRMDFAAGGGHPHSRAYECFGADHKSTHEVMAEALQVIRKAWSEDTLTFDGKFFRDSRGHRSIPNRCRNRCRRSTWRRALSTASKSRARLGVNHFFADSHAHAGPSL